METEANNENARDTVPPPPFNADGSEFGAAYERRLAEIQAFPDAELIPMMLDVHACIATVLGALPEIRALRAELGKLPHLDLSLVDGVEDYAEAAAEANSRYVLATTPPEDILALNQEASAMREVIRSDAMALATRGLLDRARLKPFQGLTGYKNVAFELIDWANLMREVWPAIQGKTALSLAEILSAKQLGERLVRAAGLREQSPASVGEVAHIRQQAMSLLVKAYDEVRRGVSFLRWREDDLDTIAPSLYAGRTHKQAGEQAPPTKSEEPVVTAQSGNGGAGATGATAATAQPAAQAAASTGLPSDKPFALV
jgi:hypothetical protein